MTKEDIIRWATQCKMPYDYVTGEIVQIEKLEAFAALVAAAEREVCAKVCEQDANTADFWVPDSRPGKWFASFIRARGQHGT